MDLLTHVKENGGATYNVATGEMVTSGLAVGVESVGVFSDWRDWSYNKFAAETFARVPFGIIGYWVNPETDNLEVDKVLIVDRHDDARRIAVEHSQLAYANLDVINGKAIGEAVIYV